MENYYRYKVVAWGIFLIAAIFYAYEYILRILPSLIMPQLAHHFNIVAIQLGHLAACYYYAYTLMQIPVGVLLDKYNPLKVLTLACLICVIGVIGLAYTKQLWIAEASRFLMGFGSAFAFVGTLKIATLCLPPHYFVFSAGLTSTIGLLAATGGNVLLSVSINLHGWQNALMNLILLGVLIAILLIISGRYRIIFFNKGQGHQLLKKVSFTHLLPIIRQPQVWVNSLIGCLLYLPLSIFAELWGIPYLKAVHHLNAVEAANAIAKIFLGWAIGAPLVGLIVSRLPYPRLVLAAGSILTGSGLLILLYCKALSLAQIHLLLLMIGLFNSSQVIILEIAHRLNPSQYAGTSIAFTNMIVMLGGALLQPLVGWLLDLQGEHITYQEVNVLSPLVYQHALVIIPLACLLAALLMVFIKPAKGAFQ